jgi:hypothetical protein
MSKERVQNWEAKRKMAMRKKVYLEHAKQERNMLIITRFERQRAEN